MMLKKWLPNLRLSISARLTLWYGCSVLLLLGLFGTYLYVSFHVGLHRDLAAALEREKTHLLRTAEVRRSKGSLSEAPGLTHHHAASPGTYVRVLSPSGHVEERTANFRSREAFPAAPPPEASEKIVTRHWNGAHARVLYAPMRGAGGNLTGWLEITRLQSDLHRSLHRLGWLLVLGGLLGTGIALAAGYGLARRALRPVSDLTQAARRVQREGFGERLPESSEGVRDELSDLADAFNDMLSRLEASFERERRFRADAAHELMTPLSAMQSEAEVTLRKKRDPRDYEESLGRILQRSQGMSALVERLLHLSRAERYQASETESHASLSHVVREEVAQAAPRAEARQLRLNGEVAPDVEVKAEEEALAVITENLVDNAIKYTPEGGALTVRVFREADEAVLQVRDTGIGFPPEEGGRLFDRFHRGSGGPSEEPGTGLGLSIARAFAERHGGTITARSEGPGTGSTFELRLSVSRFSQH